MPRRILSLLPPHRSAEGFHPNLELLPHAHPCSRPTELRGVELRGDFGPWMYQIPNEPREAYLVVVDHRQSRSPRRGQGRKQHSRF